MPRGDLATARLHREWLAKLPLKTGLQLTTIAKRVNIAPSTLTRPAKEGSQGTSTLHGRTIEKIVNYFRERHIEIDPPPGAIVALTARRLPAGFSEEATPFDTKDNSPLGAAIRAIIADRHHVMPVTLHTKALEGIGYFPGDVLIYDLNGQPQAGDVVRAQVYDRNGEIEETVWRVYDPPFLTGLTRDPALMPKPLMVAPERVAVLGVVIGMIRPRVTANAA